jgi:hypothetical protein
VITIPGLVFSAMKSAETAFVLQIFATFTAQVPYDAKPFQEKID